MHTIPANNFHKQNPSQIHHSMQPLQRTPTANVSRQDKFPKAPTGLMKHPPCIQPHVLLKKFLQEAKATSPCSQPSPLTAVLMAPSKLRAEKPKESVCSIL